MWLLNCYNFNYYSFIKKKINLANPGDNRNFSMHVGPNISQSVIKPRRMMPKKKYYTRL